MQPTEAYKVVEMFDSLEGEGKRAGATATFIRLAGCNLRCSYCDTTYAISNDAVHSLMTANEIISELHRRGFSRVTLTGGEPLLAPGIDALVFDMIAKGFEVNIETNGSVDISPFLQETTDRLFFTIDYKLPSSGETEKMLPENYKNLRSWDVLKFVVGDQNDAEHMIDVLENLENKKPLVYIGAVYDSFSLQKLAEIIIANPVLHNARLQLQFHKIIWHPEQRGV